MATHSSILGLDRAVVSHGQRRLAGYSPWGPKESDMTEHARARAHTHTHTHTHTHKVAGELLCCTKQFQSVVDRIMVLQIIPRILGMLSYLAKGTFAI